MVSGILQAFHFDVYALLNMGTTLSFITPYVVMQFDVSPKILSKPLSFFIHVSESVLAKWVYKNYHVSVSQKKLAQLI